MEIPKALTSLLGNLQFVVEFELMEQRNLPNADINQVMQQIQDVGYYLQMPRKDQFDSEELLFN